MDVNFITSNVKYYNKAFRYYMKKENKDLDSIEDRLTVYALMVKNYVAGDYQNFSPAMKLNGFSKRINPDPQTNVLAMSDAEKERLQTDARIIIARVQDIREKTPLNRTVLIYFMNALLLYNSCYLSCTDRREHASGMLHLRPPSRLPQGQDR